jgi:hypothetical protein
VADPPLWLLDVDGVLNAVCDPLPPGYERRRVNGGITVRYDPAIIERVGQLHRTSAVEIRWLTTWLDTAADHLAPALGLPLDCVVEGRSDWLATDNKSWWKSHTARRLSDADPTRALIWTDDDLDHAEEHGEVAWLHDRRGPTLAIAPDPEKGLTAKFLERIEAFAERHRTVDVA